MDSFSGQGSALSSARSRFYASLKRAERTNETDQIISSTVVTPFIVSTALFFGIRSAGMLMKKKIPMYLVVPVSLFAFYGLNHVLRVNEFQSILKRDSPFGERARQILSEEEVKSGTKSRGMTESYDQPPQTSYQPQTQPEQKVDKGIDDFLKSTEPVRQRRRPATSSEQERIYSPDLSSSGSSDGSAWTKD
eukprot:TRINITY_DN7980_c0_g1_i1.p1 TRINITY_DN7980_c0_g1~~TRINITY_DN7980_c0_g1_i1.p1  ORF type:complete len:192 (-),score=15.09 TRINITY_DN7980_c0_g1_i1:35-610(-)